MSIERIEALFRELGDRAYSGEPVTQLEHALQSAALAQAAGADDALVAAALLHDIGHLVNDQGESPTERGIDDQHQFHGAHFLKPLFGRAVSEPVRLHVAAKRYLCATRPGYQAALSADSQRSLVLQGGAFTAQEVEAFGQNPHAEAAVSLRLWDDEAKVAGLKTPALADYLPLLARCAQRAAQEKQSSTVAAK
ncbi:phosphonate degradation HD-domain oxygenase [Ramlibacter albus]|uniref:HD domain-containing protein n=1 Tax=Ramlibacter albus TaxID=2079448 RepID=A0A923MF73_9BURK|nr:phosphonate degradation HD-domain oxygenase [Ramlibacter albus]MBC5768164.1 HD domain-containing protein [Ramlibacter albus]